MDELLLENSLCQSQAEYDAIIKDKGYVADIFFINFIGFVSLFKIGVRGEMKRYKAEEASLYPKYINFDNKDVSLSVKMLFDAKVSHGAVTARMTKLLVKIKGNMLDPKDIDDDMMKELIIDSKITTTSKPSMKVRAVMNKWLDGECTIEWVAYYLYKIARLPEYKDITKEFVSVYKTGQYGQAYNNILRGERKKHTGEVPKGLQNNDPTQIANLDTPNQSDQLPTDDTQSTNTVSKDDFMALFKKAIDDIKTKNVSTADADDDGSNKLDQLDTVINQQIDDQGDKDTKVELDTVSHANDVPVENNTDYDKYPDQHHDPATEVDPDELNLTMKEVFDLVLNVSNGSRLEFTSPLKKIVLTDKADDEEPDDDLDAIVHKWHDKAILALLDTIYKKGIDCGVTTRNTGFSSFFDSVDKAMVNMFHDEYMTEFKEIMNPDAIQGLITIMFIRHQIANGSGDYIYSEESYKPRLVGMFTSRNQETLKTVIEYSYYAFNNGVQINLNDGLEYLLKMFKRIVNGELPFDETMFLITSYFVNAISGGHVPVFEYDKKSYAINIGIGLKEKNPTLFAEFRSYLIYSLVNKTFTFSDLQKYTLSSFLNNGMNDFVIKELGYEYSYLVIPEIIDTFKNCVPNAQQVIDHGKYELDNMNLYFDKSLLPVKANMGNKFILGFDSQRTARGYNIFSGLFENNWVTADTPNSVTKEDFTPENISEFREYVAAMNGTLSDNIDTQFKSFVSSLTYFLTNDDNRDVSELIERNRFKANLMGALIYSLFYGKSFELAMSKLSAYHGYTDYSIGNRVMLVGLITLYEYTDVLKQFPENKEIRDAAEQKLKDIITVDLIESIGNAPNTDKVDSNFYTMVKLAEYDAVAENFYNYLKLDDEIAFNFFGRESRFLRKYYNARQNSIYDEIPDNIYNKGLEFYRDGKIKLYELNVHLLNQMYVKGDLSNDDINTYMDEFIASDEWQAILANDNVSTDTLDNRLGIIVEAIKNNADIDNAKVNEILDTFLDKLEQGYLNVNNLPFVDHLCRGNNTLLKPSDTLDKIIKISSKSTYFYKRGIRVSGNKHYLTLLTNIKNGDVSDECNEILKDYYGGLSSLDLEISDEKELDEIYSVEKYKDLDIASQKAVLNTLLLVFNRKRQSNWMNRVGKDLYLEKILALMEISADMYGDDEFNKLISVSRMKTMLANSHIHQIDLSKMQDDLNSGVINTDKKIPRENLIKLAILNGVTDQDVFTTDKDKIVFPRGTKTMDVVKHMRGEIKLIDKVEIKLVDVPFVEVEHTEESLKKVNAELWKTRNRHHRDHMPIFEKEFKPVNKTNNVDTFLEMHPNSKVLELAFHGTGRIAGAFITRYGFADVRGDVGIGIAGKALGDGIYVAVNYNKSGIYATDDGVSYRAGRHDGYMFRLRVALGVKGVHYQYGGPEAPMFWDAPEWCVKFPTQQIDILSVFKMHSVTRNQARELLGDYA